MRKSLNCLEKTVGQNIDVKGDSGVIPDGKEECLIGNWKKRDPCYKVAKNLTELCSVEGRTCER